jgi:uncharacterized MAPEG superfamily protein
MFSDQRRISQPHGYCRWSDLVGFRVAVTKTFPLFTAAILIAYVIHRHSSMTVWGAQLYFWGRLAYVPLYAFGAPLVRSLAWNVATIGIIFVLLGLV